MSNPHGSLPSWQSDERQWYGNRSSHGVGFEWWGSGSYPAGNGPDHPGGLAPGGGPVEGDSGRPRRRLWPWLLPSVLLPAVLVGAFLGFVTPGWFYRTVLEADSVQQGVRQVARDSYGVDGIESVDCPEGEPVRVGHSFTCVLRVGGVGKEVRVVVRNEDGTYAVDRPR
ncbi:protein of unknown function [Actinopolyspora xinjiangensis]|uniref:DUF4333 domain-containing protein n=1 Tax=Actinopolyspora xinjiangensis TaxID=405564 RepID=A0A1H0WIS7_9ACTN|nr:DUF4333 domain-containing protein [Actinopolyspora xinjiangensis]SDP90640.1 protein of unknown function [Actinopolyspora xinjiangensis]